MQHCRDLLQLMHSIFTTVSGFHLDVVLKNCGDAQNSRHYYQRLASSPHRPSEVPSHPFQERFVDPVTGNMRYSPHAVDFLQQCLIFDADLRPGARQLMTHAWFSHADASGEDYYRPVVERHLSETRWRTPLQSEVEGCARWKS